jgi:hypothetical protein
MSNGELTEKIARFLQEKLSQEEFNQQKFEVFYDHGHKKENPLDHIGKLRSWFNGSNPTYKTLLADLDIAIVLHHDDEKQICVLIEIEETTDKPKVILGNVLATLLGKGIIFRTNTHLELGKYTTFIIMVSDKNQSHEERLNFLNEQISILKGIPSINKQNIGQIFVDSFAGKLDPITHQEDPISREANLEKKIWEKVCKAIR